MERGGGAGVEPVAEALRVRVLARVAAGCGGVAVMETAVGHQLFDDGRLPAADSAQQDDARVPGGAISIEHLHGGS